MMLIKDRHPSIWQEISSPRYPSLNENINCNLAIVGGGLTGILLAYLMHKRGVQAVIIEGDIIGGGTTGKTTAHVTDIVDSRYQAIVDDFGSEGAMQVAAAARLAIESLASIAQEEGIDCDWKWIDGYLYTEIANDLGEIQREVEATQAAGLNTEWIDEKPLPFALNGALKSPRQGEFHPLKFITALAAKLAAEGVTIYEHTRIQEYGEDSDVCTLKTENGQTIHARRVVLATHTPIGLNVSLQTRLAAWRSYVIGVSLDGAVPQGLFWDTEDPYHYIRDYDDVLIIGGEDHKTGEDDDPEGAWDNLIAYTRARFPVAEVLYRWSGQWYEPADGLPFIGVNPTGKRIHLATGYSGNGMTFGTIAAYLVADMLTDTENPLEKLFSPSRVKPLAAAGDFIKNNLEVSAHWLLDPFKGRDKESASLAAIPNGEGAILEIDGEQIGAYRDDTGAMTLLNPKCTHLGCTVAWNNAEKSWDCPCHGGRFTATGDNIEGPPMHPLKTREQMRRGAENS